MSPHPDAIWVRFGKPFHGGDCIKNIYRVIGSAIGTPSFPFGISVAAVIGTEDNVTTACDQIDIRYIPLGGDIYSRRDESVVEDNYGPSSGRFFAIRDRHQCIYF